MISLCSLQAMKERHNEISIHKEMLNAQHRAVNEERQQISAELHERISKIDKLRKRLVSNGSGILLNFLVIIIQKGTSLTLYLRKTPFNIFANGADPDQAALIRAA